MHLVVRGYRGKILEYWVGDDGGGVDCIYLAFISHALTPVVVY